MSECRARTATQTRTVLLPAINYIDSARNLLCFLNSFFGVHFAVKYCRDTGGLEVLVDSESENVNAELESILAR